MELPVAVTQHNVNAANSSYDIGYQSSFAHRGQSLEVRETRTPHVHAVGFRSAVAHDVVAHLAAWRFHCLVNLACRNREPFSDDLEVVNHGFHLRLHVLAVRENNLWSVGLDRSGFGHAFQALLHDANRLAQFLYAHEVTRVNIADGGSRDLKLKVLVTGIRSVAA